MNGEHQKGPSSCTFCDDGEELGVDGTEVVVMNVLGDGYAIEALFPTGGFAVHVPEL